MELYVACDESGNVVAIGDSKKEVLNELKACKPNFYDREKHYVLKMSKESLATAAYRYIEDEGLVSINKNKVVWES